MKVNKRKRLRMSKRTKAIVSLCVVMAITLCLGYLGLNGTWLDNRGLKLLPWLPTANVETWPDSIALGLDVGGGVFAEYEATLSEEEKAEGVDFNALLDSTIAIIRNRLTEYGFPEATVAKLGTTGIRVEIPSVDNPATLLNQVASTAKLEFLDPAGNVFMEGRHLQAAYAVADSNNNPAINLALTAEGAELFADMTGNSKGEVLTITLDGETLMAATVDGRIEGGGVLITGGFTISEAQAIAMQLQSGALPLDLRQDKLDTISAALGMGVLGNCVTAAAIGMGIVMLYMVIRYRLSGLVACWSLALCIILLFLFIAALPGIQLTLPGIAGIVLSLAMAASIHVILFERVKEEVWHGRSAAHAVRTGFQTAKRTVVDVCITAIVAALMLLFVGKGPVQNFAITLLMGLLTGMFSGLVVTRSLLTHVVHIVHAPALFVPGAQSPETANGEAN